ncbi:hypothetical protein UF75_4523 [Desulfosporosinus sp. I2]|uniref:hypothetical protein n=1 Tax=Desulfosporosinus sp. I2 TaxID=1617025 RepID=UPI0006200A1D|nr:hypothetical protein [Desulfosporosinus sp. I2]KJR45108.1 hypothetical protein UF75_4523 [Desulfosporosinus sp. I2]
MSKREQQAELVVECRASGMTAKALCESKGIEYHRYLNRATRLNREGQQELSSGRM